MQQASRIHQIQHTKTALHPLLGRKAVPRYHLNSCQSTHSAIRTAQAASLHIQPLFTVGPPADLLRLLPFDPQLRGDDLACLAGNFHRHSLSMPDRGKLLPFIATFMLLLHTIIPPVGLHVKKDFEILQIQRNGIRKAGNFVKTSLFSASMAARAFIFSPPLSIKKPPAGNPAGGVKGLSYLTSFMALGKVLTFASAIHCSTAALYASSCLSLSSSSLIASFRLSNSTAPEATSPM